MATLAPWHRQRHLLHQQTSSLDLASSSSASHHSSTIGNVSNAYGHRLHVPKVAYVPRSGERTKPVVVHHDGRREIGSELHTTTESLPDALVIDPENHHYPICDRKSKVPFDNSARPAIHLVFKVSLRSIRSTSHGHLLRKFNPNNGVKICQRRLRPFLKQTQEVVPLPYGVVLVKCHWIYKIKNIMRTL